MIESSDSNPMSAVPSNKINDDTPCRLCGYNLRGLTIDGRCPECGGLVSASLDRYLLAFGDLKWLKVLLLGGRIYLASFVFLILYVAIILTIILFADVSLWTVSATVLCFISCFAIGGWLLSVPDPSGLGELQYGFSRKMARLALILGTVQALFDLTAVQFANAWPRWSEFIPLETCLAQIVGIVGAVAHLQYLQKLTLRIPDSKASGWAAWLKFLLSGIWAFLYLWGVLEWTGRFSLGQDIGLIGLVIASLLILIHGVFYLIFLVRLTGDLARILAARDTV